MAPDGDPPDPPRPPELARRTRPNAEVVRLFEQDPGLGWQQPGMIALASQDAALPSARELARYKDVARNAPRIILAEFKAEGEHRRRMELEIVRSENERATRGQAFALVILLAGLAVGGGLVFMDHEWAGAGICGANLVGMAALFIRGSRPKGAEDPAEA